jgi:hypothetical protein
MRHGGTRCHPRRSALLEPRVETRHERRDLILLWFWLALRRHLARIDPIEDLAPVVGIRSRFEIARKRVDPNIPLDFVGTVTTETMLFQESLEGIRRKSSSVQA